MSLRSRPPGRRRRGRSQTRRCTSGNRSSRSPALRRARRACGGACTAPAASSSMTASSTRRTSGNRRSFGSARSRGRKRRRRPRQPRRRLPRRLRRRRRSRRRRLSLSDRVGKRRGYARRPQGLGVDTCMQRPPVGDDLPVARHFVVEPEARAAQLADARTDLEAVVEMRGQPVTHVRFEHERLEAPVPERGGAAGELLEVGDARDLEPDQVVRVVRDALGVRLGESDANVRAEAEAAHQGHSTAVNELSTLLRERQPCVVLTGAGISTESGIPDFRSPTGIWAQYDPMEYATIDAFRRDPVKVWEFYGLRLDTLAKAEPNAGHLALAELGRRSLARAVVTQNIDGLLQRAGSREVIEVHGSIRTARCLACGEQTPLDRAMPRCPRCGEIMKPGVVMFGELLPAEAMERATELAREAGLLLVVGSALEVYPVAGLPEETMSAGGAVAIVNRG